MRDILAIIPARSGSKGIKNKNIVKIEGFPLIAYSIAIAQMCNEINRIIVSTDSGEYAEIARKYGGEIPFLRPACISRENSLDIEYLQFTLNELQKREKYQPDYIVLLRPTTPLREPEVVSDAIEMLKKSEEATAVISVFKSKECPYKWMKMNDSGFLESPFCELDPDDVNLPRQSFPQLYVPDGYVDVLRREQVIEKGQVYGERAKPYLIMEESVDIDTELDLIYLKKQQICKSSVYRFLSYNYPNAEEL